MSEPASRAREPGQQPAGDGRQETSHERLDRNLEELNGELRVIVTGVQVLFAFLLVVPFNTGFAHVGGFERRVYFLTLIFAALSAACTIAPSAQHRILFRLDDKRRVVFLGNRVVILGLAFLAVAMSGCLELVATRLFGAGVGALTAALGAVLFAGLWFLIPLARRRALEQRQGTERAPERTGGERSLERRGGAGAMPDAGIRRWRALPTLEDHRPPLRRPLGEAGLAG